MKVTPLPALLQALQAQPAAPKTQSASPAVQAAKQVLAARKAADAGGRARGQATPAPSPRTLAVPKDPEAAHARDLPRGSLLDIVV